jgi:hypothetical protein
MRGAEISDSAIKTRREGLSRRFGREIDGHEDRIFVMVVSVPYRLVVIGIKPRTYFDHRCGNSASRIQTVTLSMATCTRLSRQPWIYGKC